MSIGITKLDESEVRGYPSFAGTEIGAETKSTMERYDLLIQEVSKTTKDTTMRSAADALHMAAGNINYMIDDINKDLDEIFKQLKSIIENEDNIASKM